MFRNFTTAAAKTLKKEEFYGFVKNLNKTIQSYLIINQRSRRTNYLLYKSRIRINQTNW